MEVFGLTGGIGCGKSTVAQLLAARGVAMVDADQVARDVVAPGTEGLAEVVRAFGAEVLLPDGALDRKALASRVFADEARRRTLNAITHPRIAAESAARMMALGAAGARWCLYEAALLVENNIHRTLAGLIVVTAQPAVQRARVMARDNATAADADARVAAQLPLARKVAQATHVVDNSAGRERLAERVAELYAELVVAHGPPNETTGPNRGA